MRSQNGSDVPGAAPRPSRPSPGPRERHSTILARITDRMEADRDIIERARKIVREPVPEYSYVDLGETLVAYLRGECDATATLENLDGLADDYNRLRLRTAAPRR